MKKTNSKNQHQIDDLKVQVQSLKKTIQLLKKENKMLRENNPLSFGELTKVATEDHDREALNDICHIIFKFYQENMGDCQNLDLQNHKMAKKCLRSIFKSIQKVPPEKEKKKKLPRKKVNYDTKSSSKKMSQSKKDISYIHGFSNEDTKPMKSFLR